MHVGRRAAVCVRWVRRAGAHVGKTPTRATECSSAAVDMEIPNPTHTRFCISRLVVRTHMQQSNAQRKPHVSPPMQAETKP